MLQIFREYRNLCDGKLEYYQPKNSPTVKRWRGEGLPPAYVRMAEGGESDEFFYHMAGFDPTEPYDPSFYRILGFGFEKTDTSRPLSAVKTHFHPKRILDDPDAFVTMISRWCGLVDALHGSVGLGVLTEPGSETFGRPIHYPLLKRYPAAEYDDMGGFFSESRQGGYESPRSSNWLTILGDPNIARLGGAEAIRAELDPGMTLVDYDGGTIIRAGDYPALGDGETGEVPPAYRTAARIIKPIRFEGYKYSVIKVPDGLVPLEETLKWIRRFD
jgi:hypothetical protein